MADAVEVEHEIRVDFLDRSSKVPGQFPVAAQSELFSRLQVVRVDALGLHLGKAVFTAAADPLQTVHKEACHIVVLRHFASHGDEVLTVRSVAANGAVERSNCRECRRIDRPCLPLRVQTAFLLRNAAVEVGVDLDVVLGTSLHQGTEKVIIKTVMTDTDFCIIISHSLIAADREADKINAHAGNTGGESLCVKVFAEIFHHRIGVKVVKEGILRGVNHFFSQKYCLVKYLWIKIAPVHCKVKKRPKEKSRRKNSAAREMRSNRSGLLFSKTGSPELGESRDLVNELGEFLLLNEQENVPGQLIVRLTGKHMTDGRELLESFFIFKVSQQLFGRGVHDPPQRSLTFVGAPHIIEVAVIGLDQTADLVDILKEPLPLGAGEGFDLPGLGGVDVGGDFDFGNTVLVAGELGQIAAPPEAGGVELVIIREEEVAGAVDDGHTVDHFDTLGAVGVDVHNQLGTCGGEGAIELLHAGAGDGVVFVTAVDDHHHKVADLVFFGDLDGNLKLLHGVGAGIILTGGAEFHFANVDEAELDTVFLKAQGLGGFGGVGTCADSHEASVLNDLHGGKNACAGMVTGVVIGHEGDIKVTCGEEGFATGLHQQIGTALGNGIGGVGDDSFPLNDTQIGFIESGFDTGEKFICVSGKEILFGGLVRTDVTCDCDLDLFPDSGTDLEFSVFFCEHERCSFLKFIEILSLCPVDLTSSKVQLVPSRMFSPAGGIAQKFDNGGAVAQVPGVVASHGTVCKENANLLDSRSGLGEKHGEADSFWECFQLPQFAAHISPGTIFLGHLAEVIDLEKLRGNTAGAAHFSQSVNTCRAGQNAFVGLGDLAHLLPNLFEFVTAAGCGSFGSCRPGSGFRRSEGCGIVFFSIGTHLAGFLQSLAVRRAAKDTAADESCPNRQDTLHTNHLIF